MLEIARKNYPAGQFVVGDGYDLKFEDEAFDIALCFEVLGHIPEIGPFIRELFRVTKRTCLFTIWPSEEEISEGYTDICDARLLRRGYSDLYVRKTLSECLSDSGYDLGLAILSSRCWAYILGRRHERTDHPAFRIFPFPDYELDQLKALLLGPVETSVGWRLLMAWWQVKKHLIPPGSKQNRIYNRVRGAVITATNFISVMLARRKPPGGP